KLYLGGQINKEFKCHIIKDGEVINIGKRNLKFLATPYLHWVDTMFTYVEEDQLLFTCDAFGTHYASTDVDAVDGEDYKESVKFYFDCIVKPFSKYVLNAIDKVVDLGLKFDTILTSHGPILSKNPNYNIEKYLEWSNENISFVNQNKASIFYLSAYTNTKQMALTMEDYLKNQGLKAQSYDLEKLELHELHDIIVSSKVLLLGSPTINKSMVKPLWDLFSIIDPILNHGKIAGVFGSFGWSGEGITIAHNLVKSMNFKTPVEPLKKKFTPSTITFEDCEEFAHAFVEFLK
ncbi:MAG: FprA family A-type flavoprotein, partial [Clostridioides sp.]|nr:FprA family A-type flavoprotein [Clostridioides sp.]